MGVAAISRFVLRHKWWVIAFWVIVTIVAAATVSKAVGALSQDFSVPGKEGAETNQAIVAAYGNGAANPPLVPVVSLPEGATADSPAVKGDLTALFAKIKGAAPTAPFASTCDPAFVSADGRTTFGLVFLPQAFGFGEAPEVAAVKGALAGATVGGAPVRLTGYSELESGGGGGGGSGVLIETIFGVVGALLVLAWVFGSFLALIPLLMAVVAILTTFLVIWGVTTVADVSFIVQFLVSLIGLGVAIDYALLIVTRWREEREAGYENQIAVQRAMETAGSAVVFSGTTVAIGLFALVVLPVPFLRSVGYGGMLIPLVSVVVAVTLLPVLLATVGPRLDWPRLRKGSQESKAWTAWGRLIVRYRVPAFVLASAILLLLLIPAFSISPGDSRVDALAKSGEAKDALVALERSGIGGGVLLPFEVLSTGGGDPGAAVAALGKLKDVRAAIAPEGDAWRRNGDALISVLPAVDANSPAGKDVLDSVRSASRGLSGNVRTGGSAAESADFVDAVYGNFALMVGLIALVTFLLLVRAFRSILLPLKAIILNVISVGAAFGVVTFVCQEGHGAGLIWGYTATGSIVAFIPLMICAFLFGLSMDYEVFILARMREEYDIHGDTDRAIVRGVGVTGRLVTSAALILFLAFAALGSGPEVFLKIFATGLGVGIIIDATIVRALLVPATVSLLGKWNWWLPSWLERFVPHPSQQKLTTGPQARPSIAD
ncbi:MAG: MMPL family transporter [Thermomicrobiales bacterium]